MLHRRSVSAASLVLLFNIFICDSVLAEWYTKKAEVMGTEILAEIWMEKLSNVEEEKLKAEIALEEVMKVMRGVDTQLSPYISTSELYRVNQHASVTPQVISKSLALLIDKSLYFSKITDGAFDISFASVGWYYDYRKEKQPNDALRKSLLPAINYRLIDYDSNKLTLFFGHKNVKIDLGGVAKGYAVDLAAQKLRSLGVKHASVSAGGDTRIVGDRLGRPWLVGIKNPRKQSENDKPVILLPVVDAAVSTSGDYERFYIDEKGERVHHIINPKTGTSAREVVSVTVIGPRGIDTDPLSTSVFVLGVEKGLALVNGLKGFDCVIIDRYGKVHYSAELITPEDAEQEIGLIGIKNDAA